MTSWINGSSTWPLKPAAVRRSMIFVLIIRRTSAVCASFLNMASFKSWFSSCSSGISLVPFGSDDILSARRTEGNMTRVLLPLWLICTTATVAMAQEDDTTPVYDFGEAGGVVVYDNGYAQPGGRLTVVQNDYGAA